LSIAATHIACIAAKNFSILNTHKKLSYRWQPARFYW